MKNNIFILVVFFFVSMPIFTYAAIEYNAGFVSGVWYSKTPFFENETIRIYTAFQNHSGGDITGMIKFFNNDKLIGEKQFSILNDRLIESWIDWPVHYGDNQISLKITDLKRSTAGRMEESITISDTESKSPVVFADKDTDRDGIGDKKDPVDNNSDPLTTGSGSGGGGAEGAQNIISNYLANLEQKVNTDRERVVLDIKNIDEVRRKVDTNNDGRIDIFDFNLLMVNWGNKGTNVLDYNEDKIVDLIDFNILMVYWS